MALPPTSNSGSDYFNINQCRTFSMKLGTSLTVLSGVDVGTGKGTGSQGQPCSEVIITNRTGGNLTITDQNHHGGAHGMLLADNDTYTFRGLTNVNQVSAVAAQAGPIYYRTQFFSSNPSR